MTWPLVVSIPERTSGRRGRVRLPKGPPYCGCEKAYVPKVEQLRRHAEEMRNRPLRDGRRVVNGIKAREIALRAAATRRRNRYAA